MKTLATVVLAFLVSALIGAPATAQTTTESVEMGQAQYVVAQIKGEVAEVDGNYLLVKIAPNGVYRWFNVSPDRQFIIDGQSKAVGQLTPGTLLKATIVTKTQPVTLRTTTITNGTVLSASRPARDRPPRERRTSRLHGSRYRQVHGRRETDVGLRFAEGYECHRYQGCQRP